jgi:hypothetical protein
VIRIVPILVLAIVSLAAIAAQAPRAAEPLQVIRRYPAPEAKQGVAVDGRFFYAIDDAAIGKYERETGRRAGGWKGEARDRITHLDSGAVIDTRLYCAHSNYPQVPMVSSIEIFDTSRMSHLDSIPLPHLGSATWVDRADGAWWVTFAHYAKIGAEPGKTPADTTLVQFDDRWQQQRAWAFPSAVVDRWDGMSSSGGVWFHRRLYTTGHHARELYVLEVPASGRTLTLREIIPFESEGQGIAVDAAAGQLYSIQRRTREVLVSRLP